MKMYGNKFRINIRPVLRVPTGFQAETVRERAGLTETGLREKIQRLFALQAAVFDFGSDKFVKNKS